jgi:hypothetical protein
MSEDSFSCPYDDNEQSEKHKVQTEKKNMVLKDFKYQIYSHSMVAGGLELISYTTRLIPFTLLIISLDTFPKNSYGK